MSSSIEHQHLWITVRDEDGTALYRDCVERGCTRRVRPTDAEHAAAAR